MRSLKRKTETIKREMPRQATHLNTNRTYEASALKASLRDRNYKSVDLQRDLVHVNESKRRNSYFMSRSSVSKRLNKNRKRPVNVPKDYSFENKWKSILKNEAGTTLRLPGGELKHVTAVINTSPNNHVVLARQSRINVDDALKRTREFRSAGYRTRWIIDCSKDSLYIHTSLIQLSNGNVYYLLTPTENRAGYNWIDYMILERGLDVYLDFGGNFVYKVWRGINPVANSNSGFLVTSVDNNAMCGGRKRCTRVPDDYRYNKTSPILLSILNLPLQLNQDEIRRDVLMSVLNKRQRISNPDRVYSATTKLICEGSLDERCRVFKLISGKNRIDYDDTVRVQQLSTFKTDLEISIKKLIANKYDTRCLFDKPSEPKRVVGVENKAPNRSTGVCAIL